MKHATHSGRSLTSDLEGLLALAGKGPLTVRQAMDALEGRGLAVVMLLMALPFLIPLPLPGLSTPLGLAIGLYGLRVTLRLPPWVPDFIARRSMSNAVLTKVVGLASKWGRRLEKMLRPRLKFMLWPAIDIPIGLYLLFCGIFLSLPLPIQFTNSIPAIAIVLLLLGMIERDGLFILLGELMSLALLALCLYVCWLFYRYGFKEGWEMVQHWGHSAPATQPATMP
jgi:hypothetical protein